MSETKTLERVSPKTKAVNYEAVIPNVLKAMAGVNQVMDASGFERTIHHLVQLRASQINRCAFCVKMHTREAREDGETSERLDRVIVWDQVSDFNPRERAALAWTEALTTLDPKADLDLLRAELREHFSEAEIGILTGTVAMINLWNRIGVSRH
ncbi:carboxymuconolactone decarboxylase family protein [Pelagibius litoralis]|uniref:Carboxymuconolactone decarboxylase family protein n=1 Tax=Pelagibius litoralis TaxID=374515 RepID=A0A967EZ76_9PROT|nr:carboxymuconolactone decarboxylase family protein [Pelagibius litoralis]NIA70070.1 carboxymuconolactone decarboxylase family protein [Pelagibius litoralis]